MDYVTILRKCSPLARKAYRYVRDDLDARYGLREAAWAVFRGSGIGVLGRSLEVRTVRVGVLDITFVSEDRVRLDSRPFKPESGLWNGPNGIPDNLGDGSFEMSLWHDLVWEYAKKIAEILGRAAGATEPQVAQVMCNGTCEASRTVLEWQGMQSCKGAKGWFTSPNACMFGCIGLGDCANACQFDAIGVVDGVAKVNRENCVACGACVGVCPQKIIRLVPEKNQVHVLCSSTDKGAVARKNCDNSCIGCMKCTTVCNFDAIHVEDNLARIDESKCKSCGLCAAICPTGAINSFRKLPKKEQAEKVAAAKKAKAAAAKEAEKAKAAAAAQA